MTEYFLVFTNSRQWIRRFLRPGFSHCYVLQRDEYNWFVLNPERLCLRAEIAPLSAFDNLIELHCQPCDTVLKLEFGPRDTTIRFGWFGLFSCVTVARYIMGLRLPALTPFRLYKKLLSLSEDEMRALTLENITLVKQGTLPCHKLETQ